MPKSYAIWATRGSSITCEVVEQGKSAAIQKSCTYISKKVIKVNMTSTNSKDFQITLSEIIAPDILPTSLRNKAKF